MALLLLDNYDSFTYMLKDYLEQCGMQVLVQRNDEIEIFSILQQNYQGIVLSPGPKTPRESGMLMEVIQATHEHLPTLGICLGHQALGQFFGASLLPAAHPWHGKQTFVSHQAHSMFNNIATKFQVGRYHSWSIYHLPHSLETTAIAEDGEVMAFAHADLPIWGIQFHPESCMTPHGLTMIQNWVQTL
jgi:anthranilate synthase/aminodeoxychorismate synthase-like glutamine amidotransferase